jgi:hypothetical protein
MNRLRRLSRRPRDTMAPRFDYETTIKLLTDRGLDEATVRLHSIHEHNLGFVRSTISGRFDGSKPLVGLHIGNFVGVSLAAFTEALREIHAESLVIAIDPNIGSEEVANPQEHVVAVLERWGLLGSVVLVFGYSFEPTALSSRVGPGIPPAAGVGVLPLLGRLPIEIDVALVDGNHAGSTVSRELEWLRTRARSGALVFLDDVTEWYLEIMEVFNRATEGETWTAVGHDGRIGVLELQA